MNSRWMKLARSLTATALAALPVHGGAAETLLCGDGQVSIEAEDAALSLQVCSIVEEARPILNGCHLYQSSFLELQVGPHDASVMHGCMGMYDPEIETIRLYDPVTLSEVLSKGTFLGRLPAERLFESLIVHELSHAFLRHTAGENGKCVADHEYTAYAIQLTWIEAQEPGAVDRLLGDIEDRDASYLNDFIALAAPDLFAKAVWEHFNDSENGCAFIGRLVTGQESLYREFE